MARSLKSNDDSQEPLDLVVLQVPGQRLGKADGDPNDGIDHRHSLLMDEIVKEEADRLQVARDRLRGSSLLEQMIHIPAHLLAGYLRKGYGNPSQEMIKMFI